MKNPPNKELEQKLKDTLQESATIHVGKNGITAPLIEETSNQLEQTEVVKVKVLKTVDNPDKSIDELANACNAKIWRKVGRVGILFLK